MKRIRFVLLVVTFFLASCGTQAQVTAPTAIAAPATLSSAITLVSPTDSINPVSTLDPTIFGTINASDLKDMQASALESVAGAIFNKTMDGFVANGSVSEYQVTSLIILPGDEGLLAEIKYNVKSSDAAWLADGGTQATDGWINGDCSRFDFFITDTEFQLKNKRLCG
jgi:hypothetical protein